MKNKKIKLVNNIGFKILIAIILFFGYTGSEVTVLFCVHLLSAIYWTMVIIYSVTWILTYIMLRNWEELIITSGEKEVTKLKGFISVLIRVGDTHSWRKVATSLNTLAVIYFLFGQGYYYLVIAIPLTISLNYTASHFLKKMFEEFSDEE